MAENRTFDMMSDDFESFMRDVDYNLDTAENLLDSIFEIHREMRTKETDACTPVENQPPS